MFNHGNVRLPQLIDKFVRLVLVTPDMHRVHHSLVVGETNSNFGFNLSCWDRVFGTFLPDRTRTGEQFRVGIRGLEGDEVANLRKLLGSPLRRSRTNGP